VTLCAAVVGVVAAHVIDYALVYANPVRRAEVLAATGHGYWTAAVAVAALAAALSAVWSAQRGVRSEHASVRRGARPGPTGPLVRLVTLVPVQLALFTAVEVTERAAAHASVASFLHSNELRLGLVLQVALALLLVATLRLIEQMGSDLAAPAVTPVSTSGPGSTVVDSPRRSAARLHRRRRQARAPPKRPLVIAISGAGCA
jgi:hypothetical protein